MNPSEAGYSRVGSANGVGLVIAQQDDQSPSALVNNAYSVQPHVSFEMNSTGPGGGPGPAFNIATILNSGRLL